MRLLNVDTLETEDFTGRNFPEYSILSHRWTDEEVTYKTFHKAESERYLGYQKIVGYCAFIRRRRNEVSRACAYLQPGNFGTGKYGLDLRRGYKEEGCHDAHCTKMQRLKWVGVDTCCIDKRSSAEVSEAVNSMFSWYQNAVECHVYLADMPPLDSCSALKLANSTWFFRGWTLQELLAPNKVIFCNSVWEVFGHICEYESPCLRNENECHHERRLYGPLLDDTVSDITNIPQACLRSTLDIFQSSLAQRMSWAADRECTRPEDDAYCLLGIFGINMPLIYGEGRRAFIRLQEEILKRSTDQSLLAWEASEMMRKLDRSVPVLASHPSYFKRSPNTNDHCHPIGCSFTQTNKGLELYAPLLKLSYAQYPAWEVFLLRLNYARSSCGHRSLEDVAIPLVKSCSDCYKRIACPYETEFQMRPTTYVEPQKIYLHASDDLVRPGRLPPATWEATRLGPGLEDYTSDSQPLSDRHGYTDIPTQICYDDSVKNDVSGVHSKAAARIPNNAIISHEAVSP